MQLSKICPNKILTLRFNDKSLTMILCGHNIDFSTTWKSSLAYNPRHMCCVFLKISDFSIHKLLAPSVRISSRLFVEISQNLIRTRSQKQANLQANCCYLACIEMGEGELNSFDCILVLRSKKWGKLLFSRHLLSKIVGSVSIASIGHAKNNC